MPSDSSFVTAITGLDRKALLAVSAAGAVSYALYYVLQLVRHNSKIKRLGGRARMIYNNPVAGLRVTMKAVKAAAGHNLKGFYEELYGEETVLEGQMSLGLRVIFTREPEHVKAMLGTDFASFGKGYRFHDSTEPFLGDGIFSTDGKLWQHSRALIRPFFVNERVRDLEIFERGVQKFLTKLPPSGQTVEIMDLINRLTFDETTDYLLGASANSLDDPKSEFMYAFDTVQREQMRILMMSPFDGLMSKKLYHDCIAALEALMEPYIQQTLSLPMEELEKLQKSDRDFTFLHGLAIFTRDPKVIRDQLVAVLLAGRDTTAATMSWCLYELSAYPEKYARLRREVLEVVGRSEAPTYQTLKDLKYLRFTIQETLRLYPAVPVNVKMALKDTTLPATAKSGGPVGVCKGDVVAWGPLLVQLRRDLYPATSDEFADPHVFSPERWYVWQPKPWEYVPFNGGPRVCIGQNFANTEIAYTMVRILQKYKAIEYRGDRADQRRTADIVSRPSQGVPLALYEAADDE